MKVLCKKCKTATNHTLIAEHKVNIDDTENQWYEERTYQIINCAGCTTTTFRYAYTDREMQYVNGDECFDETLYPERNSLLKEPKAYKNIPKNINLIYNETIEAYNNSLRLLCSGGIRAIIEGICVDKNILSGEIEYIKKDGTLAKKVSKTLGAKIEGLQSNGYLAKNNSKALHELRFIGNDALHALEKPTLMEMHLAIEIIEHIIENIYEIEVKALRIKNTKGLRKENS